MQKLSNSFSLSTIKTADYTPIDNLAEGPDIWLDAHNEAQRRLQADGAGVSEWVNLGVTSGTISVEQTTSGNQPTYDASDASIKWESMLFDGTDDFFDFPTTYTTEDNFAFACAFQIGTPSAEALLGGDTGGLNRVVVQGPNKLLVRFNGSGSTNSGIEIVINNTDNSTVNYSFSDIVEVIVMRKDTSNNLHFYNKDGDKIAYYAADTKTDQPLQIDRIGHLQNNSSHVGGRIGEWAIFRYDITEAEAIAVAKALHNKWKV